MVTEFRVNHALSGNLLLLSSYKNIFGFVTYSIIGRVSEMSSRIRDAIESESPFDKITYIPCFSINTVLSAINQTQIDYISLDVEGGEADVIESLDFSQLSINVFSIEVFENEKSRNRINKRLLANGYKMIKDDGQDIFFVKK